VKERREKEKRERLTSKLLLLSPSLSLSSLAALMGRRSSGVDTRGWERRTYSLGLSRLQRPKR